MAKSMLILSNIDTQSQSDDDLIHFDVQNLKRYLSTRGITTTGYNKKDLLKLASCARDLNLPELEGTQSCKDVQLQILNQVQQNLQAIAFPFLDPYLLPFSDIFTNCPKIGLYDIFNYFINKKTDFDKKSTKAYKSFEDYRLFFDGHVHDLKCFVTGDAEASAHDHDDANDDGIGTSFCCYSAKVHPTQKQKTYLNDTSYKLWIITDGDGDILLAYCQCPGGSDGACRHVGATLYSIEDMNVKSARDGPAKWVRRNKACEEPMRLDDVPQIKARYNKPEAQKLPTTSRFDPRAVEDRHHCDVKEQQAIQMLIKSLPHASVLECFSDQPNTDENHQAGHDVLRMSVMATVQDMTIKGDHELDFKHLLNLLPSSERDIHYIEQQTRGQSSNPLWAQMRKGLITASEMKRICSRQTTAGNHPGTDCSKLVSQILDENASFTTEALEWGRNKEEKARQQYVRVEKKKHCNLKVKEQGLMISKEMPFIGCSADGLVTCSCDQHCPWLIEIKCPYNLRYQTPKVAARQRGCRQSPSGDWSLDKDSPFYYQIQAQLFVYGLDHCDLIFYTQRGILTVPVKHDTHFCKQMSEKAANFYMSQVIPSLLNNAFNPIRSNVV